MIKLLALCLAGVSLGSMYAMVAMGFVVIFKATRALNFAHGSLLLLAATVISGTHERLGFYGAVALGLAVTAGAAAAIQLGVLRQARHATPETVTILTLGVDTILLTYLTNRLGANLHELGHPWGGRTVHVGELGITVNRLVGLVVAVVIISAFLVAFKRSAWGIAMRAAAEDPEAAALVGLPLGRVAASAWLVAGLLACVAAVFLTGAPTPGLSPSLSVLGLVALPAAVIGGLTSVHGALVGGLLVGLVESLTTGYQERLLFLGEGFGSVAPWVVLLLVLLFRPDGLFADKRGARV